MGAHITVNMGSEQAKARLGLIAEELGYVQWVMGVAIPNVSEMLRAIARGDLIVVRREDLHGEAEKETEAV